MRYELISFQGWERNETSEFYRQDINEKTNSETVHFTESGPFCGAFSSG